MLTVAIVQLSRWVSPMHRDHELDTDFPSVAIEHNTFLPHGSDLSCVFVM